MQYNNKNVTTYTGEKFSTHVILNTISKSLFCNITIEIGNLGEVFGFRFYYIL